MTLDKVLNIYISWIKIYIEEAKKINLTNEQIQDCMRVYRPPISEEDYMFFIYCHDSPRNCLEDDIKMLNI